MKILYITDTHDMGRNPGARIDDYHAAILAKMNEAVDAAIKNDVDAFVHGGDWWHYPKVANSIYNQHQRLLRKLKRKKIKVYAVPGNHDLYGYSMDTIDQTSIGSLANAGLITLLTRKKSYLIDDGNTSIAIHGREYSVDIDHDPLTDYDIDKSRFPQADEHILFAHGMLLQKPFHPGVRATLTKDVVTDASHVYTGHYHDGYPSHEVDGVWYHNIGSTGRDEGSTGNMKRIPQYAIIEANGNHITTMVVPYFHALAGKDVFDRTQLVQKKEHTRYLESFEQTITDAMTFDAFDPKDILSKMTGIDVSVIKDALDAIVNQEKMVHDSKLDGYIVKKKPISISEVELTNFQSHKHTVVKLNDKGLNAITGASDSGKSAVIRAIRWVLYNDPKGTDFIRHGASRTTATVSFSDGSSITRSRTRSSAGEYIVRDENGKETEFKGFGNNLPIEIANTHQMPKVELATGLERPINFSLQLDGHFLLSESPGTRAATIGRLTGVHVVDAAIKDKAKDIRKITIDTNSSEKRIEELTEQIANDFSHLDAQQLNLESARILMDSAERTEKKLDMLIDLEIDYSEHTQLARVLKDDLKSYRHVDKGQLAVNLAEQQLKQVGNLQSLLDTQRKYTMEMNEVKIELMDYENVDTGLKQLDKATDIINELDLASNLLEALQDAEDSVTALENELQDYAGVGQYKDLTHLDDIVVEIKSLRTLSKTYNDEMLNELNLQEKLREAKDNTKDIEAEIQLVVQEMGSKCPTCNQSIDTHAVEEMLAHI